MTTTTEHGLTLDDIPRYDPEDLKGETLHVGHFADLKREEYVEVNGHPYLVRWWVNRVTPADGAEYPVEVEARSCPSGTWFEVGRFGEWDNYLPEEG